MDRAVGPSLGSFAAVRRAWARGIAGLASVARTFGAIRPRVTLLTLIVTVPLVVLLIAAGMESRNDALAQARRRLVDYVSLGVEQQESVLQEAAQLVATLARLPAVNDMAQPGCTTLLRVVGADHPRLGPLRVAGAVGDIRCSSTAVGSPERDLIRVPDASGNGPAVTEFVQPAGGPVFVVATALRSPEGSIRGSVMAEINFERLRTAVLPLRPGELPARIVDTRTGRVVVARGDDAFTAVAAVAPEEWAAMRAHPGGGIADVLAGGEQYVVAYAPLPGAMRSLVVAVSRPRSSILASAHRDMLLDVAAGVGAVVLAGLSAWWAASAGLVRPVQSLAAHAGQIGTGDIAPAGVLRGGAVLELQELRTAFDEMAASLRGRDAEIAALQGVIATSEEDHRTLSDNSSDMITRLNQAFRITYASPASRDILGYNPADLIDVDFTSVILPENVPLVREQLADRLASGAADARAIFRAIRADGALVWLESTGRGRQDVEGYVVVTRDVSQRKLIEEQLEAANRSLQVQSHQDPLTGVANRRRFDESLGYEFRRARRMQEPMGIMLIDIDHFKTYNDRYGHPAGDACLRTVAQTVAAQLLRPGDLVARYGGEEFGCVLAGTDDEGLHRLGERIRAAIEALAIPHAGSGLGQVTVSIGAAAIIPPIGGQGPAEYVELADAALYRAKHGGRNAVRLAATLSA